MKKITYLIICIALALPVSGWGQQKDTTLYNSGTGDGETEEDSKAAYTYEKKVIEQANVPKPKPLLPMLPIPNTNYNTYIARDTIKLLPGFHTLDITQKPFIAKIDETLIFPVDYQDPINPNDRKLDYSKSVGATAGVVDVSPTGAATYQIPIFTPPGTAGMEPQISIVYNSQGGSGLLGVGWDISGLSAITRAPSTLYHDGTSTEVNFSSSDRFMLDGNRLIGDDPNSFETFYTEIETFSKITYKQNTHFVVETKNGELLEYGNTADSKLFLSNNSVLTWRLNKATDQNKNYIKYIYKKDIGESYISEIQYTGNSGSNGFDPYNSICFYYENIPEQFGYVGGCKHKNTKVLYAIKVKCEKNVVREYRFNYRNDPYSIIPRLIEIKEYGADRQEFNSTIVEWGDYAPAFSNCEHYFDYGSTPDNSFFIGDFDGDGRSDFFEIKMNTWVLRISDQNGNSIGQQVDYLPTNFVGAYIKSLDSDGKNAIIMHSCHYEDREYHHSFQIGKIKLGDSVLSFSGVSFIPNPSNSATMRFLTGNFTYGYGDVRSYSSDYLILDGKGKCVYSSLNQLIEMPNFNSPDDIQLLDFNGDGKTDILIVKGTEGRIFTYKENLKKFEEIFYDSGFPTKWHTLYPGDYNGDGKTDLLARTGSNGAYSWHLHFSTGKSFTHEHVDIPFADIENYSSIKCFQGDFNGDGKTDFCIFANIKDSETAHKLHLLYSKGNGEFTEETKGVSNCYSFYYGEQLFYTGDFNGNGKQQLMFLKSYKYHNTIETVRAIYSFHDDEKKNFVASITDGMNQHYHFEYAPTIIGDNSFYSRKIAGVTDADVYYISGPLYAVEYLNINDLNNHEWLGSYNYYYKNAQMHTRGKGFFGFGEKITYNGFTGIFATEKYKYIHNYTGSTLSDKYRYYGALEEKIVYNQSDTISATTYETKINNLGDKRIFANTESCTHRDYLKGTTVTESYTFDTDGNLKTQTTDYDNFSTVIINNYEKQGGWGPLNRLKNSAEMNKKSSQLYYTITQYTYNGIGNLRTKRTDDQDEITYKVTQRGVVYEMDAHQPGATNFPVYTYEYDSKDRFVLKTKEVFMGNTVTMSKTYNPATGAVLTETDAGGFTTKYRYDGFGRLINLKTPEGHIGTTNYTWASAQSNPPSSAISCIHTQAPNKPQTWTFSDILGREIQTRAEGFNKTVFVDTHYDFKGRLDSISKPYYSGETKEWTVYQYDEFGRNTQIDDNGLITSNIYTQGENKISVKYPDETTVTQKFNNHGNLIETTDNGGTVKYVYQNKQVPDSIIIGNTAFAMKYDQRVNRTELDDPNAGIIKTHYTPSDLLDYTIDARGKKTSYTYDEYNRIKTIITPETTTTYTYIKTGNAKGLPDSITNANGTGVVYKYDLRGRLITLIEKVANEQRFTTNYAYDEYGNKTEITYPGGFKVKRIYNDKGFVTEIRQASNNQLIWERLTENAMGQPKTYKMGNNKITTCEYDDYHLPNRVFTPGIQDLGYSINPQNGNMNWRKDNLKNLQENFHYDNLNRLDTIKRNNALALALIYNSNGNTEYKSDVGTYNYVSFPVHGVKTITDAKPELLNSGNHHVEYTSFHKAKYIENSNNQYLDIIYGVDNQRVRSRLYEDNTLQKTKYFASGYEKEIAPRTTREINYISTPYGTLAAYIKENNGSGAMYYLYKDHLSSITTITNSSGAVVERRSFDAWGRSRNPDNWSYNNIPAMTILERGYTGHEHLPQFGLTNMNGRMYDPLIGRFLSPDPYVHDIAGTQGFNRYAYCLNNPLKFTDPSGENPAIIVGMIVGMVVNLAVNANRIENFGQGYCYALTGLMSGALGGVFGAGFGVAQGAILGAASGFAAGYVAGAGNAWVAGEDIRSSLNAGLKGGLYGAATGAVFGGIDGGIRAYKMEKTFSRGCMDMGVDPSEALPATDATLNKVQKAWFPDAPMDKVRNFTTENIPSDVSMVDKSGVLAFGKTDPIKSGGKFTGLSDVYFSKRAFESARRLFATMGHEFMHVYQYAALTGYSSSLLGNKGFIDLLEYEAYSYQNNLIPQMGNPRDCFNFNLMRQFMDTNPAIYNTIYSPNYFNLPTTFPSNFGL